MNTKSRRQFLYNTAAAAGAAALLQNYLLKSLPFASSGVVDAAPTLPKYLFLYFDGGIDSLLAFDPHFSAEKKTTVGVLKTAQVTKAQLEEHQFYFGFPTVELGSGGPPLVPGSNDIMDGKFTPPIFQGVNNLTYGTSAAALAPFSARTTIIKGISVPPIHDPAVRMLWSGFDFNPSAAKPVLDCLIASKNQAGSILPHIIYGRSQYAPIDIPTDANQLKMNFGIRTPSEYSKIFDRMINSRLSPSAKNYVGDSQRALYDRISDLSYQRFLAQSPGGKSSDAVNAARNHSRTDAKLYAENLFGGLVGSMTDFISMSGVRIDRVFTPSADPGYLPNLQAALGFVKFAFDKNLSRVATINIGGGAWDAHSGFFETNQPGKLRSCMHTISAFLSQIDLNTTTVCIMSEFSRSGWLNERGGKDHSSGATMAIVGGKIGQGQSFGGHTAFSEPLATDFVTGQALAEGVSGDYLEPKHVIAFLLESAGYEPGRPMEILTGVQQAPAFLRKLIT